MDLTRFISLIQAKRLFLSRVDALQDRFEGSVTRGHSERIPMDHESQKIRGRLREKVYVSCWYHNEYQSNAMWSIYGLGKASVAIQTNFGRLMGVLPGAASGIDEPSVGLVDYAENESEHVTSHQNILTSFFRKERSYSHECELRVLLWDNRDAYQDRDVTRLPAGSILVANKGVSIPINLTNLIERVFVHPDAEAWIWDIVCRLVETYCKSISIAPLASGRQPRF